MVAAREGMAAQVVVVKKPQVKRAEVRNAVGQITKGHSGNPGGQPKWVSEVKKALEGCAAEGAAYLLGVIRDTEVSTSDRLRAVDIAFSYTMPKPKQMVEVAATITPRAVLQALPDAKFDDALEAAFDASPESQH